MAHGTFIRNSVWHISE